jgi:predicted DNA-binding transcriptional regulator AlpA
MRIELAGTAEVAAILQVTPQQVHRLAKRDDFPTPVAELQAGRIWLLPEIKAWANKHADRRPGRPETPRPARR